MHDSNEGRRLYETWVRDYARELHAFAFRMCGDAAQAEDLVQETFFEAWRSLDTLREPGSGRAWLYRILRFRHAHWRRDSSRRVQTRVSTSRIENGLGVTQETFADMLGDREQLQKALDSLDDRFRETFLMVFLEGMSCREAAKELEIPIGTVLSRIHRARCALREVLRSGDSITETEFRTESEAAAGDGVGWVSRGHRPGGDS